MLRLKTKINFRSRVAIKCERHTRYNPEKDGKGGIVASCLRCYHLFQIFNTWQILQNSLRDYQQLTASYELVKPRTRKVATETSQELNRAFKTLLPKKNNAT